jgi:putative membrane-bound dehydrogenase-like protein
MKPLKTNSLKVLCLSILTVLTLFACNEPAKNTQRSIDRSKLTDDQKRLPENAVSAFKVAPGLGVALFASEPMLTNPTNMDIDHKGRVWITEAYNYRFNLHPGQPVQAAGDRIVILEDTNGDGVADTSKVFYQDTSINAALGICVLGNRVIVSCSPYVFVLTDTDGDDKADKKEILFEGIGGFQHDHAIHAFTFGPDGKLYFNFGNAGDSIKDKNGNVIRDLEGDVVNGSGKPYRQGMIFRCDLDGSNFEVLANNFRNNYEVAVDAFGNMWQSDNDDDGNRGVRINYILEYGNYGYTDEMTGAGWRSQRVNMEDSIPLQHWHLNDPGVVPNLLQTGSGSPTGMLIYEGNLLPEVFRGQMIHAEPGHNVVRSYPVKKDGAGYTASIVNILESVDDSWFRPADVCIAPDGSLFIADWYDPGVGGHNVGDLNRGRVFRVAPDVTKYQIPSYSLNTTSDAIKALESPNLATRYMAWQKLHSEGTNVEKDLADIFNNDDNPRFRARAFWLLTKLNGKGQDYINQALKDKNEDIRTAAFKAAREIKMDVIPLVKQVVDDQSAQVRREALIALRHSASPEAPALWASLAQKYDGKDRWYLEALGVSADKQWEPYFAAWKNQVGDKWNTTAGRDIVWRSRAAAALPMLATIIRDPAIDLSKNLKFFRAFDFHMDTSKQRILLDLLNSKGPAGNVQNEKLIKVYSLLQLDTSRLVMTPDLKKTIDASLESVKETQQFIDLLGKYKIKNKNAELLEMAKTNSDHAIKTTAVKLLLANQGENLVKAGIHSDTATAMVLVRALGGIENEKAKEILLSVLMDKTLDLKLRQKATAMYGNGWNGQDKLMTLVTSGKLPPDMDSTAQKLLLKAWRSDVNQRAIAFYNKGEKASELPPVATLVKLDGNAANGKIIFSNTCSSCHRVNNSGINFGPDLSEIGAKYAKDGLYNNIMNPDAGIAFGYDGLLFKTKDGNSLLGYVTSETKDEMSVNSIGGVITKIKKNTIVSKTPYKHSLMPTGLLNGMKQQDVVDLIEYVSTLKQKK